MSFFLLREIFVIFIFLFYAYIYFAIDEEFIVFIILAFWTIFIIVFYLKTISAIFYDSMEVLSSEFFFFHDKKNMLLAIFRDQYYDFILLNKFLYNFFVIFKQTLNSSINNKIIVFYTNSYMYLSDSLNFFKTYFKLSVMFFLISVFSYFYNILNLLIREVNECTRLFNDPYTKILVSNQTNDEKQQYKEFFSAGSLENLSNFLAKNNTTTYALTDNCIYNKTFEKNLNLLSQVNTLRNPSVKRIVYHLNLKVYFNHLFLYLLLRDYSLITIR